MKTKAVVWTVAAVIAFLLALSFAMSPRTHAKTRAQRITSVNSLRSVTFVLTNTNPPAPAGAAPAR